MTDPSQGDWEKLFREVQTLQRRNNHPNIIALLASYTLETDESGHYVKTLHLLFPLAEMDLADWMTRRQIPSNVAMLSRQERQNYLYCSIYALVCGVCYLHGDVDGIITAHHDLKPRNILMVNGKLKLADFGHSHLRPILEGTATEGVSGLGTYEYQPPEYWESDGSRAQVKHGRTFDVWAVGCIIVELAVLVVDDWQSEMVNAFRNERKANSNRDRKSPGSVQDGFEHSFHNNRAVVEDWLLRLKTCSGSQQLKEILSIAAAMLVPHPRRRPYMWEIQMDLYEILKRNDQSIPNLERDLCVPPSFIKGQLTYYSHGKEHHVLTELDDRMETPFHRAARANNRSRTIRLWELGWPLNPPYWYGETPRNIIKRSDHLEIRELDNMVTSMFKAARNGNVGEIEKLEQRGLSPLMVDVDGQSALYAAVTSFQINVIKYLLNGKVRKHLMLWWGRDNLELPLHTAARIGFVEALEEILRVFPDIDIYKRGEGSALYYAAAGGRTDAVKWLLKNNAKVVFFKPRPILSQGTPIHAATSGEESEIILKLLLGADDSPECIEFKDSFDQTPLMLAAHKGEARPFDILLQHGASVHPAPSHLYGSLLNIIAANGRHDILRQCIESFSLEELEARSFHTTPLEKAQQPGHKEVARKEVARLLRSRIRQLRRSAGIKSGLLDSLRYGLDRLKIEFGNREAYNSD